MSVCSRSLNTPKFSLNKRSGKCPRSRIFQTPRQISSSAIGTRKWSTPLAKDLAKAIATTGPISVASYMRQCLTSPDGGYYTRGDKDKDQFGVSGDFVTSPEISQIFGELVGLWFVSEWMAQDNKQTHVYLMELGPGRGTLMDDLLRAVTKFKPMVSMIDAIYLVEASASLREAQKRLLCGNAPLERTPIGHQSQCKHIKGVPVVWCEDMKFVPEETRKIPFIVAHEFFDALPIHIFKTVKAPRIETNETNMGSIENKSHLNTGSTQWREFMVSPAAPVPSQNSSSTEEAPDFELVLSKMPTPHSLYLPQTSGRYKALEKIADAVIEISPESVSYASNIARRIGGMSPKANAPGTISKTQTEDLASTHHRPPSGAALILDYGTVETVPTDSLRGIRKHVLCSPFVYPGLTDLSANVDFTAIAESAITTSNHIEVHGPVDQGLWLNAMGARSRADMLIKEAKIEGRERVESGLRRLVDRGPTGMGKTYKAMSITPHFPGRKTRRPVGFGGSVVY